MPSIHRPKSPASASIPEETGKVVQGSGFRMPVLALLPLRDWPQKAHWASASRPNTKVLQRQVGHTMGQAAIDICRYSNKRFCQRMLSRATGKQLYPEPRCTPAESQEHWQQTASLSTPWQSKKLPTFLKDFQHFIFLLPGGSQPGEQGPDPTELRKKG